MATLETVSPHQAQTAPRSPHAERAETMQFMQNEVLLVDGQSPIYATEAIGLLGESNGTKHAVVAEVASSVSDTEWANHVAVVQSSDREGNRSFYLYGLHVDQVSGAVSAADVPPVLVPDNGATLWIGRTKSGNTMPASSLWGPGSHYGTFVSRYQTGFTARDGSLLITDASSNGTKYAAAVAERHSIEDQETVALQLEDPYKAEHTGVADVKALRKGLMTAEGTFAGRERITRDTEIGGGSPYTVDIRSWAAGSEAIVVDASSKESAHWYRHYLDSALHLIRESEKQTGVKASEHTVLRAILDTVGSNMKYDLQFVDSAEKEFSADGEVRKVNLSYYMQAGKGVCRHMALASAWLGGELKQRGYLSGKSTAEVNQHATNGAHEWMRYTAEDGTVTIVDATNHYMGLPLAKGRDYRREDEKRTIVAPPERLDTNAAETTIKGRFKKFFGQFLRDVVQEVDTK